MKRNRQGYALVGVIIFAATTLAFLLATAAIVQQASNTISQNKWDSELLNAAEIGMDYGIGLYNKTYPCALDSGPTTLPAPYLAALPAGISVNITAKQISDPTDWQKFQQVSAVYSQQLDPNNYNLIPPTSNLTISGYRIIQSQAVRNGSSRTIRSFLAARFDPAPNGTPPSAPATSTQSYFANPMFSNASMMLAPPSGQTLKVQAQGNQVTSSAPYSYNLTINSNSGAIIGQGAEVVGNVNVTTVKGSPANVSMNGGSIDGTLTSYGVFNGSVLSTNGQTPNFGNDNVLAIADSVPNGGSPTPRAPNNQTPTLPLQTPPPSPTQYQYVPAAPVPTSSSAGALPAVTADNPNVAAGDYAVTDFATSQFSAPAVFNGSSTSPVRLFVETGTADAAVQIDTSMMANASPDARGLQIWYSGSNPVNINLSNPSLPFNGLIYAPHATVSITGNGNFSGGIVANSIQALNSGSISIYPDLSTPSGAQANANLIYQMNTTGSLIQGWQSISWQELKP
jgi:hypothetical protein